MLCFDGIIKVVWDTLQYLHSWKDPNILLQLLKSVPFSPKNTFLKLYKRNKKWNQCGSNTRSTITSLIFSWLGYVESNHIL